MKVEPKKPGTVIKVRGEAITIQLSNKRKVTLGANTQNLVVGDCAPDDLVEACERIAHLKADGIKEIVL